jgi:hypothetical protein
MACPQDVAGASIAKRREHRPSSLMPESVGRYCT